MLHALDTSLPAEAVHHPHDRAPALSLMVSGSDGSDPPSAFCRLPLLRSNLGELSRWLTFEREVHPGHVSGIGTSGGPSSPIFLNQEPETLRAGQALVGGFYGEALYAIGIGLPRGTWAWRTLEQQIQSLPDDLRKRRPRVFGSFVDPSPQLRLQCDVFWGSWSRPPSIALEAVSSYSIVNHTSLLRTYFDHGYCAEYPEQAQRCGRCLAILARGRVPLNRATTKLRSFDHMSRATGERGACRSQGSVTRRKPD